MPDEKTPLAPASETPGLISGTNVKFSPPKGMEGWDKLRHKPSLAYGKYGFSARSAIKEAQARTCAGGGP